MGLAALLLGSPALGQTADPPEEGSEGSPQFSCFEELRSGGGAASETLAAQLCQGARSEAPARCFRRVQEGGFLSDPQALQLCQYATQSDDPASCFLKARTSSFLDESQLVQLCRPPIAEMLKLCPYGP
ncbi:hypothetical protein D7Y13_02440 [Corallococcus praedator]|uniref:Uncharacterized protein n=1 Tax=Corallococcus praedator TaxID=2316724 RepID=A0ABX9QRA6_9BACT|nr:MULTISPECIES: hypothetical protein [Corallococcus]RKH17868.1 hypothetical protein D7X74_11185 [Corallococcus sp. CA047B]RKH35264.1 hypothetical protein D7X75_05075 [Corallococcus sp. CA031C]RKI16405.1 hypothetical protein D7Y13_02440 [Corallococcus praedator]